MPKINYQQLQFANKPKYFVSKEANRLANEIIKKLEIQQGLGLANWLELSSNIDNHKAVRVWVQTALDSNTELSTDEPHRVSLLIKELQKKCQEN